MTTPVPHPLTTPEGERAVQVAASFDNPDALAAGAALRREFAPALASAALTQVALQRRARAKLGERAETLLFTRTGLEQATRTSVARWRAEELRARGVTRVVDLGCGLGLDALAFAEAGLDVVAVELDPETASCAAHNLAGVATVRQGRAEDLAGDLLAGADAATCVFLDPARRSATGRSWHLSDLSPNWDFVLSLTGGPHQVCVKLGPGVERTVLPDHLDHVWVSDAGDVVEASLWTPLDQPVEAAVRLTETAALHLERHGVDDLGTGPIGAFLHEPDGAALRARVVPELVAGTDARLVAPGVGYLTSDQPITSPWLTSFRVLETHSWSSRALKAWCRAHDIGTLEIKKRAIDVDPASLRRQLKLNGRACATVVLTPSVAGAVMVVVERVR